MKITFSANGFYALTHRDWHMNCLCKASQCNRVKLESEGGKILHGKIINKGHKRLTIEGDNGALMTVREIDGKFFFSAFRSTTKFPATIFYDIKLDDDSDRFPWIFPKKSGVYDSSGKPVQRFNHLRLVN